LVPLYSRADVAMKYLLVLLFLCSCSLVEESKNPHPCGNGVIESHEECESNRLGGATCTSLGYLGGELSCSPRTCLYDETDCYEYTFYCGNGYLNSKESCDGTAMEENCRSLGYSDGELGCNEDCTFNTDSCLE
jgi:hypothetical protein